MGFQVAGVSGMQLVFYPSGCHGAREGFCSFFVSCPAGCALRCWLWAGRWHREARPEPADGKDLLGRVNFARFENCMDPVDESIELALEIEEANSTTDTMIMPPLDDTLAKPSHGSEQSLPSDMPSRSDTSTRRWQPSPTAKLSAPDEYTKQLPNVFTTACFETFGESLEGRYRKSPPRRRLETSTLTPRRPMCTDCGATFKKPPTTLRHL